MTRLLREFTRFMRWIQTECQSAANPQTKSNDFDLGCESACRLPSSTPTGRHLLLLLSPKADTHFLSHRGLKDNWLSQPRWLATYRDGLSICRWSVVTHSSSNRYRRRTTALIETNVLLLCHTSTNVISGLPLILIMLLRSYSIHSHQLFFACVRLATPPYSKINIQQLSVKWKTAVYFGIWLNDFRYYLKEMLAGVQISFMGNFPRGRPFLARSKFYENCWTNWKKHWN